MGSLNLTLTLLYLQDVVFDHFNVLFSSLTNQSLSNLSILGTPVVTIQLEPVHVQTNRPVVITTPQPQTQTAIPVSTPISSLQIETFSTRPIEQVVDPPPLNVKFPSHVTQEQLVRRFTLFPVQVKSIRMIFLIYAFFKRLAKPRHEDACVLSGHLSIIYECFWDKLSSEVAWWC